MRCEAWTADVRLPDVAVTIGIDDHNAEAGHLSACRICAVRRHGNEANIAPKEGSMKRRAKTCSSLDLDGELAEQTARLLLVPKSSPFQLVDAVEVAADGEKAGILAVGATKMRAR